LLESYIRLQEDEARSLLPYWPHAILYWERLRTHHSIWRYV